MNYVIDIDGTICEKLDPTDEYEDSIPIVTRIRQINKLYDQGHKIVYLTARGMGRHKNDRQLAEEEFYTDTWNQLVFWGCKFHELHLGKPAGDDYIDDKGVNANDFFDT